jgi:hypothetical protein
MPPSDEHRRIRERGVLAFEVGLEDPRALAQAPQTCIGSFLATLVASASDKGGHPTGTTALATTLRISDTASPIPVALSTVLSACSTTTLRWRAGQSVLSLEASHNLTLVTRCERALRASHATGARRRRGARESV